MKSAHDVYEQRAGVCRDFAHLALTFCRCMGIPARYCTGYMGDIGIPPDPAPMDFSGWFQAYLSGQWYTFDARHNHPAHRPHPDGTGRDAADVALTTSFGRMTWSNSPSSATKWWRLDASIVIAEDACDRGDSFFLYAVDRLLRFARDDGYINPMIYDRLFVYGTLMRGFDHPMAKLLSRGAISSARRMPWPALSRRALSRAGAVG